MKFSYAAALPLIVAMTLTSGIHAGAEGAKFGTCDAETDPTSRACFHEHYQNECAETRETVLTMKERVKNARQELRTASDEEAEALQVDLDDASADLKNARALSLACRQGVRAEFRNRGEGEERSKKKDEEGNRREERGGERKQEKRGLGKNDDQKRNNKSSGSNRRPVKGDDKRSNPRAPALKGCDGIDERLGVLKDYRAVLNRQSADAEDEKRDALGFAVKKINARIATLKQQAANCEPDAS